MDPGPTRTFVFLDMREDSIDIGNFAPNMNGWPDHPEQTAFYDLPVEAITIMRGRLLVCRRPLRKSSAGRMRAPCRPC